MEYLLAKMKLRYLFIIYLHGFWRGLLFNCMCFEGGYLLYICTFSEGYIFVCLLKGVIIYLYYFFLRGSEPMSWAPRCCPTCSNTSPGRGNLCWSLWWVRASSARRIIDTDYSLYTWKQHASENLSDLILTHWLIYKIFNY